MPDLRVERGGTARLDLVDGDLTVGRGARITAASGRLVTVTKGAHFEGDAELDCDLTCESLFVDRGALKVSGDLTVAKGMDVAHTVKATGAVEAGEIVVGGKLAAASVRCDSRVGVGGVVDIAETLEAEVIDVGGKIEISGRVDVKELNVGGLAVVGGGRISGKARVGGVFESTRPLEFGELQVFGKCKLPAGCRGKKIVTSGKLSVAGDIACDEVDVGGVAEIRGSCASDNVRINGKLEVEGSLSATGCLDDFGTSEVVGDFSGGELHVGGRFKARRAVVANGAKVSGELETAQGIKAESVLVESGSKVRGPIVGGKVELSVSKHVLADWNANWMGQLVSMRIVGRMTNAEDVYGDEVTLGPSTRCRGIYARVVELGPGSIADKVTYSEVLRQGEGRVHLEKPSDKVDKLPSFPL